MLNKSSYEKLRLSSSWVAEALRNAGFTLREEGPAGRLLMAVAQK
jgi:hypothetical protein